MKEKQHEQHVGNILRYFRQTMRIMRLSLFFMVVSTAIAFSATTYSQSTKLSVNLRDATVREVIEAIEEQSEFLFLYQEGQVDLNRRVTIHAEGKQLQEILDEVFKGTDNIYIVSDRQVVIGKAPRKTLEAQLSVLQKDLGTVIQQPQQKEITGKVTDTSGEPLPGATVMVKGTTIGTVTDADGNFILRIPSDAQTLQVSFVGMKTQEIPIAGRTTFNVQLEEESETLEEVVVIGYGVQKKVTVTGSVAAIQTRDLLQSPQANISNALVGRLPGLLAVQRSGEPGKDLSTIRIRGIGTFAGVQDPLVMIDGIENPNYNTLDPNEIESISILKDASATAVYGVRGANGVVLITTKRGVTGKPTISLSSNIAVSTFPFLRENMNAYEYAYSFNKALAYDSYVTGNYNPPFTDEDIELYRNHTDPIFHPDIDWFDLMLKSYSPQTQHNLNIRGGTEKVKYFFSLGYFYQEGMFNTDVYDGGFDAQIRYNRYNIRSNFDFDITKRLSSSLNISNQIINRRWPNWEIERFMEMLSSVNPISTPGVIDNKIITIGRTNPIAGSGWNPIIVFDKGWQRQYANDINISCRLNYKLDFVTPGLLARGTISYQSYNSHNQRYNRNGITYEALRTDDAGVVFVPSGDMDLFQFSESTYKNRREYVELGLEYVQTFGDHNVTSLFLYNQSKYYDPNLAFLIPNGYQGLVGRVAYNYQNRYLAEFDFGYNGTENFAPGKRFGFFPAYSLGWVVSEEPFFPENDYITFLKIRGSYGEVGNDKIGGDRFLYRPTAYTYGGNYYFGEVGSSYQSWLASSEGKLGNPDLTWERAKKTNIGAELNLFQNKLSITADWFVEKRDNILWNKGTIPSIIGANFPAYNLGKMKNSGYDGEISYNDKIGNFYYFVKANYTYAHNVIEFQDEVYRPYDYQYRTGHRYGQFFGWVADGLFNTWEEVNDVNRPVYMWSNNRVQPGDIRYKDVNGDGRIDNNDQVPIGYSNFPEKIFGLSFGGNFRGLDFSVLFQGATNVSTHPSRRTTQGFYENTGASKDLLKSWSIERYEQGLPIVYPRLSVTESPNYATSTYWLENASYLRLKNMEIGYTLQANALKKVGLSSVRIYINGNNLITWCNLFPGEDPEFPSGSANVEPYPVTRIYNLGLNINF